MSVAEPPAACIAAPWPAGGRGEVHSVRSRCPSRWAPTKARSGSKASSSQARAVSLLATYSPDVRAVAEQALAKMRARLRGAVVLVYDNYNALVFGFGPTERAGDAVLSLALYPRWVNLFFLRGADLPDPERLLMGGGRRVRHIVLEDAATLDRPAVRALIDQAVSRASTPFDPSKPSRIVIKSVSARQRPRRPNEGAGASTRRKG